MNKHRNTIIMITKISIVAALYFVLTVAIMPLSYGIFQLRFSEVLVLLVFFDKKYGIAIVIGCLFANFFSDLGLVDVIFGTLATFLTVLTIPKMKHLFTASLIPPIFCIIIGLEYHFATNVPFLITTIQIMVEEFLIVTVIGYPLFKMLSSKQIFWDILK